MKLTRYPSYGGYTFVSATSFANVKSSSMPWTLEQELKSLINNYKDDLSPEDVKALNQIINKNIVKNI